MYIVRINKDEKIIDDTSRKHSIYIFGKKVIGDTDNNKNDPMIKRIDKFKYFWKPRNNGYKCIGNLVVKSFIFRFCFPFLIRKFFAYVHDFISLIDSGLTLPKELPHVNY